MAKLREDHVTIAKEMAIEAPPRFRVGCRSGPFADVDSGMARPSDQRPLV